MLDKVAIIGYSGHGLVVADTAIAMGLPLRYYCEKKSAAINPFSLDYLGYEEDQDFTGWNGEMQFIIGIGNNVIRNKVGVMVLAKGATLPNVIHPSASMSSYFELGVGNFISRQASVNTLAKIGNFCILNTGCIIEHECQLGNAVHIGPSATLAGNVQVGDFTFIGANTVIKQGVKIGAHVTIGAGTVVLNDVPDHYIMVGNPARKL